LSSTWVIKCNPELEFILNDSKFYEKYESMRLKRSKNKNFERTLKLAMYKTTNISSGNNTK